MNILTRREVFITRRMEDMTSVRQRLAAAGIRCQIKANNLTNTGRSHGVPFIKADFAYEYRVYVHKKDYDEAVFVLNR